VCNGLSANPIVRSSSAIWKVFSRRTVVIAAELRSHDRPLIRREESKLGDVSAEKRERLRLKDRGRRRIRECDGSVRSERDETRRNRIDDVLIQRAQLGEILRFRPRALRTSSAASPR
jgi:hypothetical protein